MLECSICKFQGLDINGVTYEMLDDTTAREIALQAVDNQDAGTSVQLNEASILQAVSSGQIQIIETMDSNIQRSQSSVYSTNSSGILQGPVEVVDLPVADKESIAPQYITIGGKASELENIQYVYTCKYCERSSENLEELEEHIARDHEYGGENTQTTTAKQIIPAQAKIGNRMCEVTRVDAHNEGTVLSDLSNCNSFYKCPFCVKIFAPEWQDSLEKHILESHPGRSFQSPTAQKSQNQNKRFSCLLCEKVFYWQQTLTRHVKEVHPDATEEQFEEFSKVYGINARKLAERDEPRFSCMLCDKAFKWPKSLKAHMIEFHSIEAPKKISNKKEEFFKCLFCDLATKYACSIRKHIERKHQDKIDDVDVKKLDIPKVAAEEVKNEVISLDMRPPEIRLSGCKKIYRCPFCEYATQLPSNLARHLTSRNHNGIFTQEELRAIKVKSFMVVKKDSGQAGKLPPLRFSRSLKEIIDRKKLQIGQPVGADELASEIPDIFDDERQELHDIDDEETEGFKDSGKNKAVQVDTDAFDERKYVCVPQRKLVTKEQHNTSVDDVNQENKNIERATQAKDSSSLTAVVSKQTAEVTDQVMELDTEHYTAVAAIDQPNEEIELNKVNKDQNASEVSITEVPSDIDEKEVVSCIVCKKLFDNIKMLLQHVTAHENIKVSFSCEVCQEEFAFYSKLKEHAELSHSEILKHLTPINSVVLLTVKGGSKKAVTTHECPYCEMLFSQSAPLQQHVTLDHPKHLNTVQITATGKEIVRHYNCFFCELSFVSLIGIMQHMRVMHPDVEKPGDVESWTDTPSRKSSRKRKLPKWLEKDMDVGEEATPKRRKVAELPVRINMADTKMQKQPVTDELTVENKKPFTENMPQQIRKESSKPVSVKSPVKVPKVVKVVTVKGKRGIIATDSKVEDNAQSKAAKSLVKVVKSPESKPIPRRRKAHVVEQLESPVLSEHKCPHCNFTAKRSSALTFHINFNHQNIKAEPVDSGFDIAVDGQNRINSTTLKEQELASVSMSSADEDFEENSAPKSYQQTNRKASTMVTDGTVRIYGYSQPEAVHSYTRADNSYTCSYCNKSFHSEKAVKSHIRYHHKSHIADEINHTDMLGTELVYKCTVCPVVSRSLNSIMLHIEVTHPLDVDVQEVGVTKVPAPSSQAPVKYLCLYCPFKTKWRLSISRHVGKHHPAVGSFDLQDILVEPELQNGSFLCPYCLGVMNSKEEVIQHAVIHHGSHPELTEDDVEPVTEIESDGLMKCPYCEIYSRHKKNIDRHVSRMHPEKKEEFDSRKIQDPTNLPLYRCPSCTLESNHRVSFLHHMSRQHPEVEFDLDEACKDPGTETTYFSCKYCQSLYKTREAVVAHAKQAHRDEATLTEGVVSTVQTNTQSDDSAVFYKCPICSEVSRYQNKMLEHMRDAHGETQDFDSSDLVCVMKAGKVSPNMYICKYCKQGNSSLGSLIQHSRIMHGKDKKPEFTVEKVTADKDMVNVYSCPACAYTSLWRRTVLRHVKALHPTLSSLTTGDIKCAIKPLVDIQSSSNTSYICPYCEVTCKWRKSVVRHMKLFHPGLPDNVDIQAFQAFSESGFSGGRKGTKLLQCKRCKNQNFKSIPSLKRHYEQHHPEHAKSVLSPKNVQYVYTSLPAALGQNENTQGEVKDQFQCVICGALYLWKKSLYVHVKTNHPEQKDVYQVLDKIVDLIVDSIGKFIKELIFSLSVFRRKKSR